MKTKSEHLSTFRRSEHGNILFYVLIAVALFAALNFTFSRQSRNSSSDTLDDAKVELYATQLISYAKQVQSVIDQMTITGSTIDDFDFVQPGESGFDMGSHIHKIYHPQGGGLSLTNLPHETIAEVSAVNPAGWYLGRFNNVEWTDSSNTDVILTAHQISRPVCEVLNEKITGSSFVPTLTDSLPNFLLDSATNEDLTSAVCNDCVGYTSLCLENSSRNAYSFYTVVADR